MDDQIQIQKTNQPKELCMKRTFSLMLVLLFALPLIAKADLWFKGSFDEAMATAAKEGKQILIDFYSAG
jgi:hypothetical protein